MTINNQEITIHGTDVLELYSGECPRCGYSEQTRKITTYFSFKIVQRILAQIKESENPIRECNEIEKLVRRILSESPNRNTRTEKGQFKKRFFESEEKRVESQDN